MKNPMSATSDMKSPIVYIILAVLLLIAGTNLYTSMYGKKVINEADVTRVVDEYVSNNAGKLVAGGLEEYAQKYLTENGEAFVQKVSEISSQAHVESLVADYIKNNPQAIIDSVDAWQRDQASAQEKSQADALKSRIGEVTDPGNNPVIGNPKGDVTIVEFYDYNCGYCKHAFPTLRDVIAKDKNVRVVLRDFPILSPASKVAAKVGLAVHLLDDSKYFDYFSYLLGDSGNARSEDGIYEAVKAIGMDVEKVKAKAADKKIDEMIDANSTLARSIGVRGTPAFIIGDKLIPGAIDQAQMERLIAEARKK
jgi:protein-disulfide isomerase